MIDEHERFKVFLDKEIPVHITRKDGSWANGFIKEISSNFIILEEFKQGSIVIFLSEIDKVDSFTREIKE